MAKFLFQPCEMCGCLAVSFQDFSRVSEQLGGAEPNHDFTTNLVRTFGVGSVYGGEKIGYAELPFSCRFILHFVFIFFPQRFPELD